MSRTRGTSLISSLIAKAGTSGRVRKFLDGVLEDDAARDLILHRLGTRQIHDIARIDELLPGADLDHDFADLLWLLSSNYANRGLAMLMLEEAIWLYDTVKAESEPKVAELGRAKGGTTFLLAASGAKVTSLDNGALEKWNSTNFGAPEVRYDEALHNALTRAEIRDRVELVHADVENFTVPGSAFDLIFSDVVLPTDRMVDLFDRWWPGIKPGGSICASRWARAAHSQRARFGDAPRESSRHGIRAKPSRSLLGVNPPLEACGPGFSQVKLLVLYRAQTASVRRNMVLTPYRS